MLQGMSQVATGLIAAGTPVNMGDVSADTPLHLASLYGFFFWGFFFVVDKCVTSVFLARFFVEGGGGCGVGRCCILFTLSGVYVRDRECVCVCVGVCCTYLYVCVHTYIDVYIYKCIYIHIYGYINIYMHICIYMYIYI